MNSLSSYILPKTRNFDTSAITVNGAVVPLRHLCLSLDTPSSGGAISIWLVDSVNSVLSFLDSGA